MLERVVISRRTSEQELDLLLLLEEDAPKEETQCRLPPHDPAPDPSGEADAGELASAISEWLETIKGRMEGHDRFQHAVARNALAIIARAAGAPVDAVDRELALALLSGARTLSEPGLLARLRQGALAKLSVDMPRYPALQVARRKWTGEG